MAQTTYISGDLQSPWDTCCSSLKEIKAFLDTAWKRSSRNEHCHERSNPLLCVAATDHGRASSYWRCLTIHLEKLVLKQNIQKEGGLALEFGAWAIWYYIWPQNELSTLQTWVTAGVGKSKNGWVPYQLYLQLGPAKKTVLCLFKPSWVIWNL